MEASEIELLPGFTVHEFDAGRAVLTVPSKYKLEILRMGPYIFRSLDEREDLKDPGPFTVKIVLMQEMKPPGIEVDWQYEAPEQCPDQEKFPKEWAWWHQNIAWNTRRRAVLESKEHARMDKMLLTCVRVLDGPRNVDDEEWLTRLGNYAGPPTTHSERILEFYRTHVISTQLTSEVIRVLAVAQEVTIEGLKSAFDRFRSSMGRGANTEAN